MDAYQTPPKSWWGRNWKWFVPTGCLTLVAGFVGFMVLILVVVMASMKSSEVYQEATRRAENDPAVTLALGKPIKTGLFTSGNISVSGATGEANLSIPISGPKGSGHIYAEATKSAGIWHYSALEVEVDGRSGRIDLRTALPAAIP